MSEPADTRGAQVPDQADRRGRLLPINRSRGRSQPSEGSSLEVPQQHDGLVDRETHQGKFAEHLVQLIVASAGYQCSKPEDYGDGVDITIARTHPKDRDLVIPPNVYLQVKSSQNLRSIGNEWSHDLEVHHYNILCAKTLPARYLVVVDIRSPQASDWIGHGDHFTVFHRAAYWTSLKNERGSDNSSKVAVRIPKRNRFTQDTVHKMMRDARDDFMASLNRMSS